MTSRSSEQLQEQVYWISEQPFKNLRVILERLKQSSVKKALPVQLRRQPVPLARELLTPTSTTAAESEYL